MIPKAMDSLDLVEAVMLIEEVFGTEIPDGDAPFGIRAVVTCHRDMHY
jgi:acyl carrier protein